MPIEKDGAHSLLVW